MIVNLKCIFCEDEITFFLFVGMDCLLHVLMTHCSEVDVVDRAIFYYSLLNGAADSKVYIYVTFLLIKINSDI